MGKKKPTLKQMPTPEYDSAREQNVLLDKIYSEVKTIGKRDGVLDRKLDEINNKFKEHDNHFVKIESELYFVKSELGSVKVAVVGVDTKVKEIDTRLKKVEQKLDTVTEDHEHSIHKLEIVR